MKKRGAEVREEKKRGVGSAEHPEVKAAIKRYPAIVRANLTDGSLPCQYHTRKNPQTAWRRNGISAHPPKLVPPLPGTAPAPAGDNERAQISEIEGVPPGYMYIHTPLLNTQYVNLDAYAKDRKRDKDFIPDLLTDDGISTGLYTICWVVMQRTSILQMRAAYWANLTVMESIDWNEQEFLSSIIIYH